MIELNMKGRNFSQAAQKLIKILAMRKQASKPPRMERRTKAKTDRMSYRRDIMQ
jgi:hypothetical protein